MESKTQPKKKAGFNLFDEDDTEAAPPAAPSTSRQSFRGFRPDFSQPPVRNTVPPSANKATATSGSAPATTSTFGHQPSSGFGSRPTTSTAITNAASSNGQQPVLNAASLSNRMTTSTSKAATTSTFGQQTQQASSGLGSRPASVITNGAATKTAADNQQPVPNVASPPAIPAFATSRQFRACPDILTNATTVTTASANGHQPVHNSASISNIASRPPVTLTSASRAALINNVFTEAAALPKFNQPRAPGIVSPLATTTSSTRIPVTTSSFGPQPQQSIRPFGPRPTAAFNLGQTRVHPVINSSNGVPPDASHEVSPPATEENGKNKEDNALAVNKVLDVEKMRKSLKEFGLDEESIDAAVVAAAVAVKKDEEVLKLALRSTKEEKKESSEADLDKDGATSVVPSVSNTNTASASKPAGTVTNTQQPQRQFAARPPMKTNGVSGAADSLPLGARPVLTTPPSSKTAATSDVDQPLRTLRSCLATKTVDITSIGEPTQTLASDPAPMTTDSAIEKTTTSNSQPVMASVGQQAEKSSIVSDKLGLALMALPNKDFLFKSKHYQVPIHKFVLGARSMYFYQQFFENPASSFDVKNVDDFDQEVIELAVNACYDQFFDEATLDEHVAEQLLKFAEIYGMPCLKDLLKQTAANCITEENVCSRASHACDTDDSELRQRCADFIAALITQNKLVPRGIEALPAEFGKEIVLAIAAKHVNK